MHVVTVPGVGEWVNLDNLKVIMSSLFVQIPAGIQTDQRIRLSGKGIARVSSHGFGDHYVHIKIKVPK